MATEVLNFELTQRGSVVGSQQLRTELRGGTVNMEARLQLSGALGRSTIRQQSRSHVRQHHSLAFREEQQKRRSEERRVGRAGRAERWGDRCGASTNGR